MMDYRIMQKGLQRTVCRFCVLCCLLLPFTATTEALAEDLYYTVKDGVLLLTDTPDGERTKRLRIESGHENSHATGRGKLDLPVTRWDPLIKAAAAASGVDSDLVKAVVWAESNFDATALSPKGAIGLMQLMPATAAAYGVSDARMLRDPERNLDVGTRHLRDLLDRYSGDTTLALAAYNAGAGAVKKYRGVPAYRETQNYIRKIHRRLGGPQLRRHSVTTAESSQPIRRVARADGTLSFSN